jgi:hypothetical protein
VKVDRTRLTKFKTDWLAEPKLLRRDVITARPLVGESAINAYVRVMNCSEFAHRLRAGESIGLAEPVISVQGDEVTNLTPSRRVGGDRCREGTEDRSLDKLSSEFEHLQDMVDTLPGTLTDVERQRVIDFIKGYKDLFSKSEFDLGRTALVQHRIDTGDSKPFKEALCKHPMGYLPVIDEHVEKMLQADVIEPATSPWASNVKLVRRKDNSLHFCVDYRRLNS